MRYCCWLVLLAGCLQGQAPSSFNFRDFASTESLRMVASARRDGTVLRLTPAKPDVNGAAWHTAKQVVSAGFETEFQFRLTDQGGLGKGADGLAFVLQNSGPDAIAGRGSSGGFAIGDGQGDPESPGIARSIAVFFDTFHNGEERDPSDNYIAIRTHGRIPEMQWPPARLAMVKKLPVKLKDKRVHLARITFEPPVMRVFLDNMKAPVLTSTVDLSTVLDADGTAYVGFTASTGGGWENHDVLSWRFNGLRPAVSSDMSVVTSDISFLRAPCLPERNLCTPERAIVEERAPGEFYVVLPANLEWGASIPLPRGRNAGVSNARGLVCWDPASPGPSGCGGPATSLISRTRDGRIYFSVKDPGNSFADNQGFFEFEVRVR